MLQQGIMLLDRFCQDDRIRIRQPRVHEVIVANARKVRLIGKSRKKDDRLEAQTLVRARTSLVNTARSPAKSYGERLRGCDVRNRNPEKAEALSPELQSALEPLLAEIESLSERIAEYNDRIEALAQESYPQVALLKQIKGVGRLIALTFLLTLEDPPPLPQEPRRGLLSGAATGTQKLGTTRAADAHQQRRRSLSAQAAGAGSATHLGTRHRL